MSQYKLESRWVTAEGIAGVNYRFGDLVRIKSGEHSSKTAEVIALLALEPEPMYGVTLPPNENFWFFRKVSSNLRSPRVDEFWSSESRNLPARFEPFTIH